MAYYGDGAKDRPKVPLEWKRGYKSYIFPNAVSCGPDYYVARVHRAGGEHLGRTSPRLNGCLYSYGGAECFSEDYEVLTADQSMLCWKDVINLYDILKLNPIIGGREANGFELYICRVRFKDAFYPAKFGLHLKEAIFSLEGKEIGSPSFEILAFKDFTEQDAF